MAFPLLLVAALQLQVAAPQTAIPRIAHARNGQVDVQLANAVADATLVIDGRLDEPVWKSAALLTGFSLYQPIDGREAPDSAEVLVWYSPTAIHFGVRAFEPHGAVRATLAERDRVTTDDNVELHLDTFQERRRAFVFIVNPLGVQADGTKSEGGGFIPGSNVSPGQNDLSADFVWQSKGRITEWGYEVEVRIPFNSLRYPTTTPDAGQRWGFQVDRKVQHSGYEETWTPVKKANASFIAQEGWLSGLRDMQHGPSITINPELTNTIVGAPPTDNTGAWKYNSDPKLGGNLRVGLGSNFVLNGTVKPDFSQVEADAAQVAADQRFALFYPERRPFFVEGADQFNAPNTLVYTRRIVQPDAALKLTGKVGRANVALLSALDARFNSTQDRPLVDILRLTQDFHGQSTAGLLYSERVGNGRSNRMASADMRIVFGKLYYASLQASGSATNQEGVTKSGAQWEAVVDRTGRSYGFHYGLLGIAPEFRTDNGFVARTGFVQPSFHNRYTLYGTQGSLLERWNVFVQSSSLWRYDDFFNAKGALESRVNAMNQFTFRHGWSFGMNPALGTFAFDPGAYTNLRAGATGSFPFLPSDRIGSVTSTFSLSTPQYRRFAATLGTTVGNDVFFLETSRARRLAFNGSLDLRPTERIRLNATYVSTKLTRIRDGSLAQSSRIPRVKLEYQVARPVFVRLVAQYEAVEQDALRDPRSGDLLFQRTSSTTFEALGRVKSNSLRADVLFSYRPKPGIVLFAGYGNTMVEPGALSFDRLHRVSDGVFVKASYVFGTTRGSN